MYFLSGFIPRDRRAWVFGCWDGRRFADNSGALFRYCNLKKDSPIKAIWVSRRKDIVNELRSNGYRAYHAWSVDGLLVCLRAGVFIFDGYTKDINHWASRGAKRVYLQHGVGGLKKIEREIDIPTNRLFKLFHGHIWQKMFWRYLLPWHCTKLDLVLAASEQQLKEAQTSFGVSADIVAITGLPRNDIIFDQNGGILIADDLKNWIQQARDNGNGIFLYMPTFRDTNDQAFPLSWSKWNQMLGDCGAKFIVHKHFADTNPHPQNNLANVYFLEKTVDAYPLFMEVDGLITDYSSVAYDFMLTGKSIIYFIHDFENYISKCRGLRFDFDSVTPGPKARTLEQLADALALVIAEKKPGKVRPDVAYEHVRDFFHAYCDNRSAERAYNSIFERFTAESTEP
jgi:CDP-glycerol glycerophosphotransferase (TagB/SpsB family)